MVIDDVGNEEKFAAGEQVERGAFDQRALDNRTTSQGQDDIAEDAPREVNQQHHDTEDGDYERAFPKPKGFHELHKAFHHSCPLKKENPPRNPKREHNCQGNRA